MRNRSYSKLKEKSSKVTQDEIDSIREEARSAQIILENSYFISYLQVIKDEILAMHAKQLVYDAEEEHDLPNGKRKIKIPSQKEYDILAGQYRLAEKIVQDMEQAVAIGKELEQRIKDETVEVASD
jgi:hypothetical protein